MTRRTFADVERGAKSAERVLERDGFRELIEQKRAGLRRAITQGRISADMADQIERVMISMTDDVNAGLHRMDLSEMGTKS